MRQSGMAHVETAWGWDYSAPGLLAAYARGAGWAQSWRGRSASRVQSRFQASTLGFMSRRPDKALVSSVYSDAIDAQVESTNNAFQIVLARRGNDLRSVDRPPLDRLVATGR